MNRYLTKAEMAERFRCHTNTIDRWVKSGRLPKPYKPTERKCLWLRALVEDHERRANQAV